eukprot:scaffold180_cov311-Pinguiococcus_pyrenoidosus.AAC.43
MHLRFRRHALQARLPTARKVRAPSHACAHLRSKSSHGTLRAPSRWRNWSSGWQAQSTPARFPTSPRWLQASGGPPGTCSRTSCPFAPWREDKSGKKNEAGEPDLRESVDGTGRTLRYLFSKALSRPCQLRVLSLQPFHQLHG